MLLQVMIKKRLNGEYWAYCPSLPGCSAWGQTEMESLSIITVAAKAYLAKLGVCTPWEPTWAKA